MKRFIKRTISLVLLGFVLSACQPGTDLQQLQGSTEAGNPPLMSNVQVVGGTPTLQDVNMMGVGCVTNRVIARDDKGNRTNTPIIQQDCSFSFSLPVGTYTFALELVSNEILDVMVPKSPGSEELIPFNVELQDGKYDLGKIKITGYGTVSQAYISTPRLIPSSHEDEETTPFKQTTNEEYKKIMDPTDIDLRTKDFYIIERRERGDEDD